MYGGQVRDVNNANRKNINYRTRRETTKNLTKIIDKLCQRLDWKENS